MPDLILSDGREITLDLTRITLREYRRLLQPTNTDAEQQAEDAVVARVAGLTVDEYQNLPQPDWRLLIRRFFEKAREPLSDPN